MQPGRCVYGRYQRGLPDWVHGVLDGKAILQGEQQVRVVWRRAILRRRVLHWSVDLPEWLLQHTDGGQVSVPFM